MKKLNYLCNNLNDKDICHTPLILCEESSLPLIKFDNEIRYGLLKCPACKSEYPIIDFVPILIMNPFYYLRNNFSVIDAYLKYTGTPIPDEVRKSLFDIFLRIIKNPNEPIIDNKKGYQNKFISFIMNKLAVYYGSQYGHEWDKDLFSLGRIDISNISHFNDEIEKVIKRYSKDSYETAIDIGANIGGYTHLLAERFHTVYGLDASYEPIHSGTIDAINKKVDFSFRNRCIKKDLNYINRPEFLISTAEFLPLASGSIDFALCLNIIDAVMDPYRLLTEISRVLNKGGRIIITSPFESSASVRKLLSIAEDEIKAIKIMASRLGLKAIFEKDDILWRLNEYKRKTAIYNLYMVLLEKT